MRKTKIVLLLALMSASLSAPVIAAPTATRSNSMVKDSPAPEPSCPPTICGLY